MVTPYRKVVPLKCERTWENEAYIFTMLCECHSLLTQGRKRLETGFHHADIHRHGKQIL